MLAQEANLQKTKEKKEEKNQNEKWTEKGVKFMECDVYFILILMMVQTEIFLLL